MTQLSAVFVYAVLLLLLLVVLWVTVTIRSLMALFGGGLLVPKAGQGPAKASPAPVKGA
jgi:hypothetical protein